MLCCALCFEEANCECMCRWLHPQGESKVWAMDHRLYKECSFHSQPIGNYCNVASDRNR